VTNAGERAPAGDHAPAGIQLFELREDRSETVSKPAAATLPARSQAAA
jgi:hypothetical protein